MIAYLIASLESMGPGEPSTCGRLDLILFYQRLSDLIPLVCCHGRRIKFVQPPGRSGKRSILERWSFRVGSWDLLASVTGRPSPSRLIGRHDWVHGRNDSNMKRGNYEKNYATDNGDEATKRAAETSTTAYPLSLRTGRRGNRGRNSSS